ncbi:MAG TPA: ABC transporter permease [Dehalococcoidales bacterium]|nr:ABC transporter permease [Dehalococcoidales bacterium]
MRDYIIRRLLLMIPTMFVVTIVVFLLIRFVPGSIVEMMMFQMGGGGESQSEETISPEAIRQWLGLDKPMHVQYAIWMNGIFTRGDFGTSLWTRKPVLPEILARLPITFELGFFAFVISQLIALPVGIISAIRQDSWLDYLGRSFAIIVMATPGFWLGTMIVIFPSIWWGWSPEVELISFTKDPAGNLVQFLVPAALLGSQMSAATMRMLRTTMLDILRQDYIRTAWAKGLRERVVIMSHVLKNAMIPVITMIAGQLFIMIGGTVIMEQIFNLPGMGRLFLDAIFRRDYSYVSGINFILASIGLVLILVTDLSYAFLDPRIRYR